MCTPEPLSRMVRALYTRHVLLEVARCRFVVLACALASALLASCSPGQNERLLFGTWEPVPVGDVWHGPRTSVDVVMQDTMARIAVDLGMRTTYGADGSVVTEGSALGIPIRNTGRWAAVEERGNELMIEIEETDSSAPPRQRRVKLVFESA